jgi:hypothetical protein
MALVTAYSAMAKTIDGLPVYRVHCRACDGRFEGRLWRADYAGQLHYCDQCCNVRLSARERIDMPAVCKCGGVFRSQIAVCPGCGKAIRDAEGQLAVQYYILDEPCEPEELSPDQLANWLERAKIRYMLTEGDLFIQVRELLAYDKKRRKWRYYKPFAI